MSFVLYVILTEIKTGADIFCHNIRVRFVFIPFKDRSAVLCALAFLRVLFCVAV